MVRLVVASWTKPSGSARFAAIQARRRLLKAERAADLRRDRARRHGQIQIAGQGEEVEPFRGRVVELTPPTVALAGARVVFNSSVALRTVPWTRPGTPVTAIVPTVSFPATPPGLAIKAR